MLLNDAFENFGRARVIPNAIGVDDCDGPLDAHAQAICFSSADAAFFRKTKLFESMLEILPRLKPFLHLAALWLRLIAA